MFRNCLTAALRSFARNRLYAVINITGLAVGFAAAIAIGLFVQDEYSYDRFWPGYDHTYLVVTTITLPGRAPIVMAAGPADIASQLRAKLPSPVRLSRLRGEQRSVRIGQTETLESILWVDPNFFSVLRPERLSGDLDATLRRPDGIVLTRTVARKFFGDADPIGRTVLLDREHVMSVGAVISDLPVQSHLSGGMFASGLASFSELSRLDALGDKRSLGSDVTLYVSVPPGVPVAHVSQKLQSLADGYLAKFPSASGVEWKMRLLPIADVHLGLPAGAFVDKPPGDPALLYALMMIGVLIVAIAAINFVCLMTARAGRRAVEIGVRKASGAAKSQLALQFIGESVLYSVLAMVIAIALIELILPALAGVIGHDLAGRYWQDLTFWAWVAGGALLTGVGAGVYPALVLASLQPAGMLKSATSRAIGSGAVRQALVVVQFAILIGLILATLVVYRQVAYALNEALRLDTDQVIAIETNCVGPFVAELRKLPGVRAAACSQSEPLESAVSTVGAVAPNAAETTIRDVPVEPGFLELYGLRPVAGRFFSRDRMSEAGSSDSGARSSALRGSAPPDRTSDLRRAGSDSGGSPSASRDASASPDTAAKCSNFASDSGDRESHWAPGPVVINETAVRKLGFRSPAAAIGASILWRPAGQGERTSSEIIGVAPDFPTTSARVPVDATAFYVRAGSFRLLSVKLIGSRLPETLDSIDRLWKQVGEPRPINRLFVNEYFQNQYTDDRRLGQMFAAFAGIAVLIACLGLFGLSAFAAERRTKEIAFRKVAGAGRHDIVRMLLWQFTLPVFWANLIAWPVGYYFMTRWLHGFAYHVDLEPWMFVAAGGVALVIALLTVSGHAILVARARPVVALRYE